MSKFVDEAVKSSYGYSAMNQHLEGWLLARDHIMENFPSRQQCIDVLNEVTTPFGEEIDRSTEWAPAAITRCEEALRGALRDMIEGGEDGHY